MPLIPKIQSEDQLHNARIGFQNLLTSSDIVAAEAVLIPNTFQRYLPASGAVTTRFQLGSAAPIDFIAIAAHNFGNHVVGGVPVLISYATTISGALIDIEEVRQTDNRAIMVLFDSVTVAEIAITHDTTAGLEYGVVYAGTALQMQRPIYGGHSPINLSADTKYQSVMSESGQFLGRTITRQGSKSTFSWRNLDDDWYRENFQPFVDAAKTVPFFIAWRPDAHISEVAFSHTTADITPVNQGGGNRLMSVDMSVRGHNE